MNTYLWISVVCGWLAAGVVVDFLMRNNEDYLDAMIDTFHINYPLYLAVKWIIILFWPFFALWLLTTLFRRKA